MREAYRQLRRPIALTALGIVILFFLRVASVAWLLSLVGDLIISSARSPSVVKGILWLSNVLGVGLATALVAVPLGCLVRSRAVLWGFLLGSSVEVILALGSRDVIFPAGLCITGMVAGAAGGAFSLLGAALRRSHMRRHGGASALDSGAKGLAGT